MLLQQTRVAHARPYFERFVRRFPTVEALAAARETEVLKLWEGAGYYARARNLHRAAREVVHRHGGRLPDSAEGLETLPGVGPYIAAAVASLAFQRPVLALEANGLRVGARWLAETRAVRRPEVRRRIARALEQWMPPGSSGEFNEALMELGETLCVPHTPQCPVCPVRTHCRARAELPDPGAIPAARDRPAKPTVEAAVVAVWRDGRWLVQRRPPDGLLGGLWELPGGKLEPGESPEAAARRELTEETGLRAISLQPAGELTHEYSHFRARLHLFYARQVRGSRPLPRRVRWVDDSEFEALPRPQATIRALARIRGLLGSRRKHLPGVQ